MQTQSAQLQRSRGKQSSTFFSLMEIDMNILVIGGAGYHVRRCQSEIPGRKESSGVEEIIRDAWNWHLRDRH